MNRPTHLLATATVGLLLSTGCGTATDDTPEGTPFSLYTHCGIHELKHDGTRYVREGGRLDDGQGNPSDGWDNPYHAGYITVEDDTAVFRDDAGHEETFVERVGATGPLDTCS